VGSEAEIPFDAEVIDAEGKVVFPGMVLAHTSDGLDRANENVPVTPYVDVYDAIDPHAWAFEQALRHGITTLHVMPGNNCVISGTSRIVEPRGMMVDDMTVRPEVGIKISITPKTGFNRMTQMATLRKAFEDLEEHVREVAEKRYEEEQEKQGEKVLVPPDEAAEEGRSLVRLEDLDRKWQTLYRVSRGEVPVWLHCDTAADVLRGIEWLEERELLEHCVFVLGTETYKVVDAIAKTGRPVVLSENLVHVEKDPLTGEETETFVPGVFAKAGIVFALQTWNGSMGEGLLWYQAARLVREGVARETALKAVTQWPADILGLGGEVGAVEVGRRGDLLILSGDPLDQATVVEQVLLDGQVAYERSKDRRLEELLRGEELPPDREPDEEAPEEQDTEGE
jgi:imidazolonepropionase-like amidohydrolase